MIHTQHVLSLVQGLVIFCFFSVVYAVPGELRADDFDDLADIHSEVSNEAWESLPDCAEGYRPESQYPEQSAVFGWEEMPRFQAPQPCVPDGPSLGAPSSPPEEDAVFGWEEMPRFQAPQPCVPDDQPVEAPCPLEEDCAVFGWEEMP